MNHQGNFITRVLLSCALSGAVWVQAQAAPAIPLPQPTHLGQTAPGTRFLLLPGVAARPSGLRAALVTSQQPWPEFIDDDTPGRLTKTAAGGEVFLFKQLKPVKSRVDGQPTGIMAAVFQSQGQGKDWVGVLETPAAELKSQKAGSGTSIEDLFPEEHLLLLKKALENQRFFSPNCGWWELKNQEPVDADTPSLSWVRVENVTLSPERSAPVRVFFRSEKKPGRYFMDLDPYTEEGSFGLRHCLRVDAQG